MKRIILILFNCMLILVNSTVFAKDLQEDYNQILDISKIMLSVFSFVAYAIALGILIWIGIKYMLSNANEKANLKGVFPKYILGVALIFTCATIASSVANISSGVGDNTAGGLIDKGFEIGKLESSDEIRGNYDDNLGETVFKFIEKDNRIMVYAPEDVNMSGSNYSDKVGQNPVVTAPEIAKGRNFEYWFVVTEKDGQNPVKMMLYNNEFIAEGTDGTIFTPADTRYTIYAVYEGDEDLKNYLTEEYAEIDYAMGLTPPSGTVEPDSGSEPTPSIPEVED